MSGEELHIINTRFNEQLQRQIAGTLPKGHVYQLGNAGHILQLAGIEDLPVELSAERLLAKSGTMFNHPFNLEELKCLPKAINSPIAVFDSTKKDGSKVILTELQYKNINFVAVLRVRKRDDVRKIDIRVNDIRSIYPKDHIMGIIDWLNSEDGLVCWMNKEKILDFISTQSTNLIGGGDIIQDLNSATKLQKNIETAKQKVKNFINPTIIPSKNNPQKTNIMRTEQQEDEIINLTKLSKEEDQMVRRYVARNPNTPISLLEKLSNDESEFVRSSIAERINTPVSILEQLSCDESDRVRFCVARNPNTPVPVLEKLSKDEVEYVGYEAMGNPNTPAYVIEQLDYDDRKQIRKHIQKVIDDGYGDDFTASLLDKLDLYAPKNVEILGFEISKEQEKKFLAGEFVKLGTSQYKGTDCAVFAKIEKDKIKAVYVANKPKQSQNQKPDSQKKKFRL